MKVRTCETIDLDIEADISFDDVISMFADMVLESELGNVAKLTAALDCMTRVLGRVSDEAIILMNDEQRGEICDRLNRQRVRYEQSGCGMAEKICDER